MNGEAHLIGFDRCVYGTRVNDALIKKPTRLITNAAFLCLLAIRCDHSHIHGQLCGRTALNHEGKRVPATRMAAVYPDELVREWSRLARKGFEAECGISAPSASLRRWRRIILRFLGGDVELHPGPTTRRDVRRDVDLLGADVTGKTAVAYSKEFELFEIYCRHRSIEVSEVLRVQGAMAVVAMAGQYLAD